MNPSEEKAKAPEKTKALCVATRCTTVEQFVATFHRFCDESSFFVATLATRPVGLETAFSIQLEDKTPVLRGLCVVVEAWSTPANRFGRPGVRLNVRRLTNESLPVFKQLQAARIAAEAAEKAKADAPAEAPKPEATPAESKPVEKIEAKPVEKIESKPVEKIEAKPPEKPKTLADKLAEIKSQPKPPAIPPRKTDGIPPIPSAIPKITPTAFAVKPTPPRPMASPVINVEIDEPTKIEAKTAVRAEGTAPVTRTELDAKDANDAKPAKLTDAKLVDRSEEPTATGPAPSRRSSTPAPGTTTSTTTTPAATSSTTPADSTSITSGSVPSVAVTSATSSPVEAPSRPTPPPRSANVTTPAIGISTSTINLSNAALTAEDTHAQAPSYPDSASSSDTASIVDVPPKELTAAPEAIAASDDMTSPVASESRAPGSSFVLPANPLMNLSDKSLEGFVDCALYEETGNFFRAPGYEDSLVDIDDVAAPPGVLAPAPAIRPGDEVSQAAYVITPTPAYVAQHAAVDMTPVPVTGRTPTQPPYPTGQMAPLQYPTSQLAPMQYPTGQMPPQPYPTGQMQPLQYPQPYPTGQMPPLQYPMQSGTTNPPYAAPKDSTESLLAMSGAPSRRRWMIVAGAAVVVSAVLLVIVIATRGDGKTATAATTPPPTEKKPEKVTMAVTETPPSTPPSVDTVKAPTTKEPVSDDEEHAVADPNGLPVVGTGPCKLTVTTTPAGSIVRMDDQVMGPSPITIQSTCARKRIDVKHPRYAPGMKWVTLAQDQAATVDIPLNRPTHAVTIITQPAGATISIAGRRAGTTPTSVQMMGFTKVSLTIEKKGYKTVVESIYSKVDGERRTVTLTKAK